MEAQMANDTKPRAGSVISSAIDIPSQTLTVSVRGVGEMKLRMADVSPACATYAMLHGFKQRVCDAGAMSRNPDTGESATPEEKFAAMFRLVEHYASGTDEWNLRASGGGSGGEGSLIVRALAEVQGTDPETMREKVERNAEKRGVTVKAYLAGVAKIPAVAEAMARLRPAPVIDADELLGELRGDE
jgi:hypothetical protein